MDVYGGLRDEVTTYIIVHVGTLIFIALLGLVLYMLVKDLPGRAARIARVAVIPFVVCYATAAVAFRGVGAPLTASVLLGLSAIVVSHPPPIGPVGLVCFAGAVAVLARSERVALPTPRSATAGTPASA